MNIGPVDLDQRVLVIAEIGNNHEGDRRVACDMVEAAADAGADAVKVQVINPARLVHQSQAERIAQLSRYRLPIDAFADMASVAERRGVLFMASAFDGDSLRAIAPMCAAIKIASGDLDFVPLLTAVAGLGKPILLSTGMATLDEVRASVDVIAAAGGPAPLAERLALLHCVSLYPTPLADANLAAIGTLARTFGVTAGYSDHTLGIEAAILSLSQGARIIEKHFTLDKTKTTFRDHALSADPADMRRLTDVAHLYPQILGSGEKMPCAAERDMAVAARRSVVAARDLPAGTRLTETDFDYVRPRSGSAPAASAAMVGRSLRVPVKRHDPMHELDLDA